MAQVDVKWPSEDEEFDAKIDGAEPTKVSVVDQNDNDNEESGSSESESTDNTEETPQTEGLESSSDTEQEEPETAPEVPDETEDNSESEEDSRPEESQVEDTPEELTAESEVAPTAEESISESDPTPEPETPAEDPEPTPEREPEAPRKPVTVFKPTAVSNAASETEKPQVAPVNHKGTGHLGRNLVFVALILVIAGLGAWSWMLYSDRDNLQRQVTELKKNPQDEVQRQSKDILSKLDAQINLPQGENPTIANVTDAASAKKESEFFTDAKNGDKVVVYVNAGIAILYRPSTNKVILVAPLTIDKQKATTGTSTNTQTPAKNTRGTTNGNTLQ